jgi:hypothetical protein
MAVLKKNSFILRLYIGQSTFSWTFTKAKIHRTQGDDLSRRSSTHSFKGSAFILGSYKQKARSMKT